RDIQHACQRLRQQGLPRARWPDQENVALAQLDVVVLDVAVANPLVMVVDGHRQGALGLVLTNDVTIKEFLDFGWRRQLVADGIAGSLLGFFQDDVVAKVDALIADEHRRPGDKLANLMLILAAEGAMQGLIVARTFFFGHRNFRSIWAIPRGAPRKWRLALRHAQSQAMRNACLDRDHQSGRRESALVIT